MTSSPTTSASLWAAHPPDRPWLIVAGTRPELIKLAPVILELQRRDPSRVKLCVTGQHRQMVDSALEVFGLTADLDLNLMQPGQSLSGLMGQALTSLGLVLDRLKPAGVVVQGDTTTVAAAAWAGFLQRVPVAHVEAGLRTYDRHLPFPEEVNRRSVGLLADLHFAPTHQACQHLLAEGVEPHRVQIVGNTVVDALRWLRPRLHDADLPPAVQDALDQGRRPILVTAHRRESFGQPLRRAFQALRGLIDRFDDVEIIYPVHLNPQVQEAAGEVLAQTPRVHLIPPLDYRRFVATMTRACLILTDSGGVQEEAPSLGVPVLVMRDVTERPEGVQAGVVHLVGTDPVTILETATRLLTNPQPRSAVDLYGDGLAARRIVATLLNDPHPPPPFIPPPISQNANAVVAW